MRLQQASTSKVYTYLEKKHSITISNTCTSTFLNARNSLLERRLQDFQFKILHDIYPTTSNLHKWKIKESNSCNLCGVKDDLRHSIYDCEASKISLKNLIDIMNKLAKLNLQSLSYNELLLGTRSIWNSTNNNFHACNSIDTILTIIKKTLIDMRENKRILTKKEIERLILHQIKMEKLILDSKHFKKKWKSFLWRLNKREVPGQSTK